MASMSNLQHVRRLGVGAVIVAFAITAASSCSDTVTAFGSGGGGSDAPGVGGQGGAPSSCEGCGGATPICFEDTCVSSCPLPRAACHPSEEPTDPSICCEAGQRCCPAAPASSAAQQCRDQDEACPFTCPDGVTVCEADQFCQLDATTMGYTCGDDCDFLNVCGATTCCPTGSRCDAGACALADLAINAPRLASSARMELAQFAPNSCEIQEGCVQGSGERTLLRFDLETPNIGSGDLVLGDPSEQQNLFEYSPCHNHFHFNSYADYSLENELGAVVAVGHKQAFCLLD